VKLLAKGAELDVADAVTALLRVAPEGRRSVRDLVDKVEGALASALRHALGGEGEMADGNYPALWIAAERARSGESAGVWFYWKKTVS
jgi:hypothetical protein